MFICEQSQNYMQLGPNYFHVHGNDSRRLIIYYCHESFCGLDDPLFIVKVGVTSFYSEGLFTPLVDCAKTVF